MAKQRTAVEIIIGARDAVTSVLNRINRSVDRSIKGLGSFSKTAKRAGAGWLDLVGILGANPVFGEIAQQASAAANEISNVRKEAAEGEKVGTATKLALGVAVGALGFQIGKELSGINDARSKLNDALLESARMNQRVIDSASRRFSDKQFRIDLDPDNRTEALARHVKEVAVQLRGAKRNEQVSQNELDKFNESEFKFMGKALKMFRPGMDDVKKSLEQNVKEAAGLTDTYQKQLDTLKQKQKRLRDVQEAAKRGLFTNLENDIQKLRDAGDETKAIRRELAKLGASPDQQKRMDSLLAEKQKLELQKQQMEQMEKAEASSKKALLGLHQQLTTLRQGKAAGQALADRINGLTPAAQREAAILRERIERARKLAGFRQIRERERLQQPKAIGVDAFQSRTLTRSSGVVNVQEEIRRNTQRQTEELTKISDLLGQNHTALMDIRRESKKPKFNLLKET